MSAMDLESNSNSRDAGEPVRSPPPATVVGLGPPEPPVAGATPYAANEARDPIEKQTLVGFPGPPPSDDPELEPPLGPLELADADSGDDEVTVVGGYDEVTVVTPNPAPAIARMLAEARTASRDPERAPITLPEAPPGAAFEAPGDAAFDGTSDPLFDAPTDAGLADLPDAAFGTADDDALEALPDAAFDAPTDAGLAELPDAADDAPADALLELARGAEPERFGELAENLIGLAAASTEASLETAAMRTSLSRVSKPPPPPRPLHVPSRPETVPPPSSDRDLFVSRDTELQIFAPPVEMFGPGPLARSRFDSLPPRQQSYPNITQSDAPWYMPVEPEPVPPPRRRSRAAVVGAVVTAVAAIGLLSGALLPKSGSVLITTSGPLDAPVSDATVFVDGKRACTPAPCRVTLERGAYVLSVSAPAYRRSAEKSLSVSGGDEEALHFALQPDDSAGIEIKSEVAGLRVLVDGLDRGTTPVTVRGLSPGKHGLKLTGSSRYALLETELELAADRVAVFEPKLTLLPEPDSIEVIETVELASPVKASAAPAPAEPPLPAARARALFAPPVAAATVDLDTPDATPAAESVTLSIRSSPPSNVVVDGRPLGSTPREIAVTPGEHSVVFVHPSKGRRSVRVRATAGKSALASVDF